MFDKKKKFSAPKEGHVKIIVNDSGRILEDEMSLEELEEYGETKYSCGCSCGGNCKCHDDIAERTIPEDICVPVDPFISYARVINPTADNVTGKFDGAVELWGDRYGNCMVVDPDDKNNAMLATDPVVIGTQNAPLGVFIPRHISNEGIDFVCNFFEMVKEDREAHPYKALEGFI